MNQRLNIVEAFSKVLKKSWLILLLVIVLAAGARFVSANYITKIYKAETIMFIGTEQDATTNFSLSELEASNKLIIDYKELANSRYVIEPVIEKYNVDMSLIDFRKSLSLTTLETSRLFTLSFSSENPVLAAQVANEMATELMQAVSDVVNVENIRIIDTALVPDEPVSPNLNIITLLAGVIGLILSLLIIYFHDLFNDAYTTQESVERELEIDTLAVVPRFKAERGAYNKSLIALNEPNSMLAESFKMLRTNINYMIKDDAHKVLMMTSSVGAEGKTTASSNLAIAMAQEHKKVLLIDGDLRRPNLFRMFKINMMPGLTDIIYGKYTLAEATQRVVDVPGLDVLTTGRLTSMTTELLGSVAFNNTIDEARARYDYIIIDAPPILNVSDTVIISRIADRALFVVAMDKTNKTLVREAKRNIDKVGAKLMGVVLTNMTIDPRSYYYGSAETKRRGKSRR